VVGLAIDPARRVGFVEFYEREWAGAVRLAALLTQQRAVAEDIAQDALTRVMPKFGDLENASAYLRIVVLNECRKWHRHNKVERSALPMLAAPDVAPFVATEVADAVAALPYRQRAVLVLRYHADLSEVEIAAALGCRVGTVKSLSSRALQRLRKEITQ
jgi:DNA-directed RNA polymerase specialized sigma24 family protein